MVSRCKPVTRSTVRMLVPSMSNCRASKAFSMGIVMSPSGLAVFFGVGLITIGAAKALQAITVLAEPSAFNLACEADHFGFGFQLAAHVLIIQQPLAVIQVLV
jgi:hypothetical protein